jgi:multidrug/hemolysin transport system ATP-binding protein
MESILQISNIVKTFADVKAVDDVSFAVKKGSMFAFLGQNGAGKSTTINVIIGLLPSNGGEIIYGGNERFESFKSKIGVVFQNNVLDDNLTVEENILTYGQLYIKNRAQAKRRTKELIALFKLENIKKKFYKALSGGQKRKIEIAAALFNDPAIIFLDEPTTGLDPQTRKEVWDILHGIREASGLTVFLTTHYMEETADADNVVIIHKGKKVCEGTPAELRTKYTNDYLLITPISADKFETQLKNKKLDYVKTADTYKIKIADTKASIRLLYDNKDDIKFYEAIKGDMDDVFLNVVGERAEAE